MNNKARRIIGVFFCLVLMFELLPGIPGDRVTTSAKTGSAYAVTDKERDAFFGKSAIIGNSVGLGLKYYFNNQKSGYLGNPKMLVWGCYSFLEDFNNNTQYMIHWNGQPMKARNAVKACKAKHVFINMGTNDFNTSRENIYANYKRFIREIKQTNPDVDIYILATTPTRKDKGLLSNSETNKLNSKMKKLAEKRSDMYFIDINTPMKDSAGLLKSSFTSDGFVHLTWSAYKTWTDTMVKFVKKQLKARKKATANVKNAAKRLTRTAYGRAKDAVAKLDKCKRKKELTAKLKTILKRIEEKEEAAKPTSSPELLPSEQRSAGKQASTAIPAAGNGLSEEERSMIRAFRENRVTHVKVKTKVENKVSLTWEAQSGASVYLVLRSQKKKSGYKEIGRTTQTAYTDKTAKKRKNYYYKIKGQIKIRAQYYSAKKSYAKNAYVFPKTPKTVIAGECFVVGMNRYQSVFNKNHHFVGKIGVNTYTMMHSNYFNYQGQSITGLERIAYYHPDRVFFLIGANESAWYKVGLTMNNYTQMRKLLRKVNPHMEIILIKIAPFGYHPTEQTASVSRRATWNNAYKDFAKKNADTYYCTATDVLDDGNSHLLSRYDAGDGTHWNGSGTELVVKKIREWSKNRLGNW